MKTAISIFGVQNGRELCLRAIQAGVPVGHAFMKEYAYDRSVCATALEATYDVVVLSAHVIPTETWFTFLDPTVKQVKLRSTIQPQAFATLPVTPVTEQLVNDMCESGQWVVWG